MESKLNKKEKRKYTKKKLQVTHVTNSGSKIFTQSKSPDVDSAAENGRLYFFEQKTFLFSKLIWNFFIIVSIDIYIFFFSTISY